MPKKIKLSLKDLNVESFTTTKNGEKGGAGSTEGYITFHDCYSIYWVFCDASEISPMCG